MATHDALPVYASQDSLVDRLPLTFLYSETPGLVSVIVPTYNRATIVGRAIESALRQRYGAVEVVVVDDGSRDATCDVVAALGDRVRYVRQENAGVAAARNRGLSEARGEFVAFLDSDDAWDTWKIGAEISVLRAHPEVGLVWTDMAAVDDSDRVVEPRYLRRMYGAYRDIDVERAMRQVGTVGALNAGAPDSLADAPVRVGDLSSWIVMGNVIHTSTVLMRRAWAGAAGAQRPDFRAGGEDYEFYTRVCQLGPVAMIDAPAIRYRVGAADQLTAPERLLPIAYNNLRTVGARVADLGDRLALPEDVLCRRMAWSLQWIGELELEAHNRTLAARYLVASIMRRPRVDKRAVLLATCALPLWLANALRAVKRAVRRGGGG